MSRDESAQAFVDAMAPHIRDVFDQGFAAGVESVRAGSQDKEKVLAIVTEVLERMGLGPAPDLEGAEAYCEGHSPP